MKSHKRSNLIMNGGRTWSGFLTNSQAYCVAMVNEEEEEVEVVNRVTGNGA